MWWVWRFFIVINNTSLFFSPLISFFLFLPASFPQVINLLCFAVRSHLASVIVLPEWAFVNST